VFKVFVCVCVVEKVCGFVVCCFLSFCFFDEALERKDRGAQNSLSPGLPLITESDSFSPKKSEKSVSNQSSLHVTFCY